jgi:putative component of membrane protein insertase Oxa1/YidC/SpoIIIJ protein YidD
MDEMPNQDEREAVRIYCCERPLERPKTSIATAVVSVALFFMAVAVMSFGVIWLASWLGINLQIRCIILHPIVVIVLSSLSCFALSFLLILKRMTIGIVRLYQHYAPEDMRRKCILKPTCSEYMILAVEKYGAIRGVKKSVHRLLITCRGWDYRVDEP